MFPALSMYPLTDRWNSDAADSLPASLATARRTVIAAFASHHRPSVMIAIDTSVLLAAHRPELGLHDSAIRILDDLAESRESWYLPLFAVVEFLRQATQSSRLDPPSTSLDAVEFVHALVEAPGCRLLVPGDDWAEVLASTRLRLNKDEAETPAMRVAALCREHAITELITSDQGMERFLDARIVALT
jgi:predicted nucleic acid-binding protein